MVFGRMLPLGCRSWLDDLVQLLASGREADVYDLGDGRVLRRSRHAADTAASVMIRLAQHGFPVPVVYQVTGPDLIMQRISGPSLLTALVAGDVSVAEAAATLVDLHHRLHQIPVGTGSNRILHLDLHPDNVLLGPSGPVLIDWTNSVEGPPALDTAVSALILAQVAVGDTDVAILARDLLLAFAPSVDAVSELPAAVRRRRADPAMTARELAELDQAADLVRAALT